MISAMPTTGAAMTGERHFGRAAFVGRRGELSVLEQLRVVAAAGGSGALAVVGPLGIGKTRLLDELCERAHADGFEVLAGKGSELESGVPLGLVLEAIAERLGRLAPAQMDRLGHERLSELAAVIPELGGGVIAVAPALDAERYRLHHAVRAGLEQLARERPLLLVFDDVHWGDPASLELLAHLLRRRIERSVIAIAFRPHRVPPVLRRAIESASRAGDLRSIELSPLTVEEAAGLLEANGCAGDLGALHRESGGNPFFLEQLARVPRQRGDATVPGAAGWTASQGGVPRSVVAAIEQEVAGLSAPARALLEAGAVAGEPFGLELASTLARLDPLAGLAALAELRAADLLRVDEQARRIRFRHPVVRRAIYDALAPGRRLAAHRRAARLLGERDGALAAQAYHVERSAVVGDEGAIGVLTAAGRSAAARAPASAARWYDVALRLLPPTAEPGRRLELLIPRAAALAATGRLRDTRAVLAEALGLVPADDPAARGQITAMLAAAEQGLGRGDSARRLLTDALAQAAPASAQEIGLMLELAENHMMAGEWDEAASTAARAVAGAELIGHRDLALAGSASVAWLAPWRCAVDEGRAALDRAAGGIDALDDSELTPLLLRALVNVGYAELALDGAAAACAHAERGLRVCRASGRGHLWTHFMINRAAAGVILGRLEDARESAERTVESALLLDNDQVRVIGEALRCWAASLEGDIGSALAAGRDSVEAAARAPDAIFGWMAHVCYGEALIEAGQVTQGRDRILTAGGPELADVPPMSRTYWQTVLVAAELATGRVDAAEALTQRIERVADSVPLGSLRAEARYARADVLLATGAAEPAAGHALESAAGYDAAGFAVRAARARILAGRALARAGDPSAARRELEAAHAQLTEFGAARLADRAARELRSLGRRIRGGTKRQAGVDGPPGGLSPRECEVADLVTLGYTNREIGARLFVSEKTVEKHVASLFAKLGVSSRAAVAATVERARTR